MKGGRKVLEWKSQWHFKLQPDLLSHGEHFSLNYFLHWPQWNLDHFQTQIWSFTCLSFHCFFPSPAVQCSPDGHLMNTGTCKCKRALSSLDVILGIFETSQSIICLALGVILVVGPLLGGQQWLSCLHLYTVCLTVDC